MKPLSIVILGLSITSSWGNGHATTYRALVRALARRGHDVLFLERDMPWYAANRDLPRPPYARTSLYHGVPDLKARFSGAIGAADAVIVGSFVPDGAVVTDWVLGTARGVRAFYDIDTPVTVAKLARGDGEYLTRDLVPRLDLYLSFTGGPMLRRIEDEFGAPMARALYCSVDPSFYFPRPEPVRWDLGYLGTYSDDRQPKLEELLLAPARAWPEGRFAVAGAQYPDSLAWPSNVRHVRHLPPGDHVAFYCGQRFTLNVTRADMVAAGYSPSVRLFEAAACGTPIISDGWPGLAEFLAPGSEIVVARDAREVLSILREMPEARRREIADRARRRVLAGHTAEHRARELERHLAEAAARRKAEAAE